MKRSVTMAIVAACGLFVSWDATAFEVDTAFSDPCHERMTIQAAVDAKSSFERGDLVLVVPKDDPWDGVSDRILGTVDYQATSMQDKFVIWSFLAGVRSVDTNGHAVTDLDKVRSQHIDPEKQYLHCLRGQFDDGEQGNANAIDGAKKEIVKSFDKVNVLLAKGTQNQNITVDVYTDFYGIIGVKVWGPAYHMGRAAHTLQDCFSHTIRSEDLTTVYHTLNFVDALRHEHSIPRDGMAHSGAMDRCNDEASEIAKVAQDATTELFLAVLTPSVLPDAGSMEASPVRINSERLELFMDTWMQVDPDCTRENNFCDSPWTSIAEQSPTKPIMPDWIGCGQSSENPAQNPWVWAGILSILGGVLWRRRKK